MMPPGNRYAAAMDPQSAGPPAGGPPQGPPSGPPGPPQGAPPEAQGPPANPALVEALRLLSGHEGPIGELLKDPAALPHLKIVLTAVKQDPGAMQGLQQAGIGPEQVQQFEQLVARAEQGGQDGGRDDAGRPAPHWLAGGL